MRRCYTHTSIPRETLANFIPGTWAWAASRYTEARLDDLCKELFNDIDKDTVDFVDNYDNTLKEPTLLPASFPSVLVNANTGIAVGMASSICPFNLAEVCQTTIALMRDPEHDIAATLLAPDFPGGGPARLRRKGHPRDLPDRTR